MLAFGSLVVRVEYVPLAAPRYLALGRGPRFQHSGRCRPHRFWMEDQMTDEQIAERYGASPEICIPGIVGAFQTDPVAGDPWEGHPARSG